MITISTLRFWKLYHSQFHRLLCTFVTHLHTVIIYHICIILWKFKNKDDTRSRPKIENSYLLFSRINGYYFIIAGMESIKERTRIPNVYSHRWVDPILYIIQFKSNHLKYNKYMNWFSNMNNRHYPLDTDFLETNPSEMALTC